MYGFHRNSRSDSPVYAGTGLAAPTTVPYSNSGITSCFPLAGGTQPGFQAAPSLRYSNVTGAVGTDNTTQGLITLWIPPWLLVKPGAALKISTTWIATAASSIVLSLALGKGIDGQSTSTAGLSLTIGTQATVESFLTQTILYFMDDRYIHNSFTQNLSTSANGASFQTINGIYANTRGWQSFLGNTWRPLVLTQNNVAATHITVFAVSAEATP